MARLDSKILGIIKGKLSNLVFRERNGKVFIYSRPTKQKISRTKAAIEARKKFATAVLFAKEINANKTLSEIWNQSSVKATNAYQKIIKANSKLTDKTFLSLNNKITPEGISFDNVTVDYNNKILEIKLDFSSIRNSLLKADTLFCLVYFYYGKSNLNTKSDRKDSALQLNEFQLKPISKYQKQNFEINLKKLADKNFDNGIVYIALTGKSGRKYFCTKSINRKFL